jgi:murein DD-endopeptidase MepM/ murein hydrolase activator NlpD
MEAMMRVTMLAMIGVLGVVGCTSYRPLPPGPGSWEEARRAAYGRAAPAAPASAPEPRVAEAPVVAPPTPVRDAPVGHALEPKPLPPLRPSADTAGGRDVPTVASPAGAPAAATTAPASPAAEPTAEEPASARAEAEPATAERDVAAARSPAPPAADASLPPPALSGVGFLWPVPAAAGTVRVTDVGDEGALAIEAPAGEPFIAAENGVVVFAGDDLAAYGRMVVVRHDGDYTTAYGHAERLDVAVGDVVRRGQRLGLTGTTGEVTTPQLYFEMRVGSRVVDPRAYLVEAPRLVAEG